MRCSSVSLLTIVDDYGPAAALCCHLSLALENHYRSLLVATCMLISCWTEGQTVRVTSPETGSLTALPGDPSI